MKGIYMEFNLQKRGTGYFDLCGLPANTPNNIEFKVDNVTKLLISGSNGKIGVGGNTNPQFQLDIKGNLGITHISSTNWEAASLIKVDNDVTKAFVVENTALGEIVFNIWGNGIVNAKKIYAEEISVIANAMDISWYDHVFNQDYKLMSLSELEQFIKINKHLPEIPSEKEVKENGLDLAKISGKLLLKIEELTLYIIEQEKKVQEMQKRLSELEARQGGE
jgi:hypothetical protein